MSELWASWWEKYQIKEQKENKRVSQKQLNCGHKQKWRLDEMQSTTIEQSFEWKRPEK